MFTRKLLMLVALVTAASAAHAQNIVGDWQGTLKLGPAELRLVLHIAKGDNGVFTATLDSIDQAANGIPVSSMSLKEAHLDFTVEAVRGSYKGRVNSEGTVIAGTWTQGEPLPLEFKRTANPIKAEHKPAKPSDIDGHWLGTLEFTGMKLRLVFHITNTADGLTATLDSPDQNANGIPVTSVTRNGAAIKMELKQIAGGFEGKIDKDLTTMEGAWTQGRGSSPLTLKRIKSTAGLSVRHPQDPVRPFPYREEDLTYQNKTQGVELAATLTIPSGKGPFTAVLLITGSGPQDRDEALLGHRPFLVLSDYLTRKGIAVLRADDRGIGKSTGNFETATTADFATDAEAGISYLKTRPEIDHHKIGLIGHSEGGVIAPMVAARNSDVAFIVMMAGSGVPGDAIIAEQLKLIEEAAGKSHEQAEKDAAEEREILALVIKEKDEAELDKKLREKLAGKVPQAQLGAAIKQVTLPWVRYFITYDPAPALTKVKCPVLAINGERDLQVPPRQNLPAIRKALEAGGNKDFEVDELPGLNHLFQTAKTGAPSEYAGIEETISPIALEKMADWILKRR